MNAAPTPRTLAIAYTCKSHEYKSPWKETTYFCPCCGSKSVWNKNDGGDYYMGETFACVSCNADWCWPGEPSVSKDDWEMAEMASLRAAIQGIKP